MSWEDEDESSDDWAKGPATNNAPAALVGQWDDEDEDEETLLGSNWDEEEKPKAKPIIKPKTLTKRAIQKKEEEMMRKAREAEEKRRRDPNAMNTHKADLQRQIEEADHALADDLFGASMDDGLGGGGVSSMQEMRAALQDITVVKELSLDDMKLKTEEDFEALQKVLNKKLRKIKDRTLLVKFLNSVIKSGAVNMKLDDMNKVKRATQVICTEKQKAEKSAKKKKVSKHAALKVGGSSAAYDDYGNSGSYAYDDYDFI